MGSWAELESLNQWVPGKDVFVRGGTLQVGGYGSRVLGTISTPREALFGSCSNASLQSNVANHRETRQRCHMLVR